MIWAALALLGIPLWFIAILLFILVRSRSAVQQIPGSFPCKARAASGDVSGLHDELPRYHHRAHWVHDVLVVHGGNPFLIQAMPLGVARLASDPEPADPTAKHLTRVKDPVSLRYRLDSGAEVELVCTRAEVNSALGPFPARAPET
jgi:hypothetical protein